MVVRVVVVVVVVVHLLQVVRLHQADKVTMAEMDYTVVVHYQRAVAVVVQAQ
jgi:hypothetical protein